MPCTTRRSTLLAALALLACAGARAAGDQAPASPPSLPPEPQVTHTVIDDDHARIDELRVRGRTVRIVVQPKRADGSLAPEYEIVPADAAHDTSGATRSGLVGQRLWRVLTF